MMTESDLSSKALVAGLAARATDLTESSDEILRTLRRGTWERRVLLVIMAIMLAVLGVCLAYLAQVYDIGRVNRDSNAQITSCTTPGGRCYQQGQRQTAQAVAQLQRVAVAATICGRNPNLTTITEVQACVTKIVSSPAQ